MLENFGPNTNVKCHRCYRTISVNEAEVTERVGKRLVTLECKNQNCPLYARPEQYDEMELEIRA
jgi:hypothetical protein